MVDVSYKRIPWENYKSVDNIAAKPTKLQPNFTKGINPRFKKGQVLGEFKKGGKVKKSGAYKLHKGERVLNKKQTKKYDKARKKHFGI